jgi:hypothetical protein
MATYEQLAAVGQLLQKLLDETDHEALRAKLAEGPFFARPDGKPWSPGFDFEQLTIGQLHTVAILADQLYQRTRAAFPGNVRVVTGGSFTSAERGPMTPEGEPPAS